jgi:hypothetical protein
LHVPSDHRTLASLASPRPASEDAPFGYVGVFKDHVNIGFFHGTSLPDPAGLLEGTGKFMRHVKVKLGLAVDRPALEALVIAAYRDIVTRLTVTE